MGCRQREVAACQRGHAYGQRRRLRRRLPPAKMGANAGAVSKTAARAGDRSRPPSEHARATILATPHPSAGPILEVPGLPGHAQGGALGAKCIKLLFYAFLCMENPSVPERAGELGVNFGLCGNQACKLCQNLPLWEVPATAASVLPKRPVRITAGNIRCAIGVSRTGEVMPRMQRHF
jgi:hypothetical protein